MHTVRQTLWRIALFMGSGSLLSGCTYVNVKQLTYEVLRQEDCRRNQLEDFCARNFASEYHEYERLRKEFLRSQNPQVWRVARDESTLTESF